MAERFAVTTFFRRFADMPTQSRGHGTPRSRIPTPQSRLPQLRTSNAAPRTCFDADEKDRHRHNRSGPPRLRTLGEDAVESNTRGVPRATALGRQCDGRLRIEPGTTWMTTKPAATWTAGCHAHGSAWACLQPRGVRGGEDRSRRSSPLPGRAQSPTAILGRAPCLWCGRLGCSVCGAAIPAAAALGRSNSGVQAGHPHHKFARSIASTSHMRLRSLDRNGRWEKHENVNAWARIGPTPSKSSPLAP